MIPHFQASYYLIRFHLGFFICLAHLLTFRSPNLLFFHLRYDIGIILHMHFQIWLRFSRPHFLIMGIYWYKNGGYVTWQTSVELVYV